MVEGVLADSDDTWQDWTYRLRQCRARSICCALWRTANPYWQVPSGLCESEIRMLGLGKSTSHDQGEDHLAPAAAKENMVMW